MSRLSSKYQRSNGAVRNGGRSIKRIPNGNGFAEYDDHDISPPRSPKFPSSSSSNRHGIQNLAEIVALCALLYAIDYREVI